MATFASDCVLTKTDDHKTPKLVERIELLFNTLKWHDFEFKLFDSEDGVEEIVYAHRLILASSSPVFEALCYGPMAEKTPVIIPDIDPLAFKIMLKFMYTDNVEFSCVETACNVLYASKKYLINSLAKLAISYISFNINEINCVQIYDFAAFVQEENLMAESINFLCAHLEDVLKYLTPDSMSKDLLLTIIDKDALNGGEMVLIKICLLWAEGECYKRDLDVTIENFRDILIDIGAFSKLRFLTLNSQEFNNLLYFSFLLSNQETEFVKNTINKVEKIKNDIVSGDSKISKSSVTVLNEPLMLLQKEIFEDYCKLSPLLNKVIEARKEIPLQRVYCHRYIQTDSGHTYYSQSGYKIITTVTANKTVRLTGIFLNAKRLMIPELNHIYTHNRCTRERDYSENILIKITNNQCQLLHTQFFSKTVRYGSVFKVPIQKPVVLDRSKEFFIQIKYFVPIGQYPFGIGNSVTKFPSGLCIKFKDYPSFGSQDDTRFKHNEISVISGLELYL